MLEMSLLCLLFMYFDKCVILMLTLHSWVIVVAVMCRMIVGVLKILAAYFLQYKTASAKIASHE